jgi:cation diffusion facilitator CzcD-associated flavoprotein CzcO
VLTVEKGKEVGGVWNANTYPVSHMATPWLLLKVSSTPNQKCSANLVVHC